MMNPKKNNIKKFIRKIIRISFRVSSIFILICLSYLIVHWYKGTSIFNLKRIVVKNNYMCNDYEIIKLSGLKRGERTIAIDNRIIEAKIKKSPYIKNATVKILYPARVVVTVVETEPIGYIMKKGILKFINRQGNIIGSVKPERSYDLPIIEGNKNIAPNILKTLIAAKDNFPYIYSLISEIYENNGVVTISLVKSSAPIIIGKNDFGKRLEVLESFLLEKGNEISFKDVEYIDIRFNNKVILKAKEKIDEPNKKS